MEQLILEILIHCNKLCPTDRIALSPDCVCNVYVLTRAAGFGALGASALWTRVPIPENVTNEPEISNRNLYYYRPVYMDAVQNMEAMLVGVE